LADIIRFVKCLEISAGEAGVGNNNIKKIYSTNKTTIVRGNSIIIINIKKNSFIIEFNYNNINNIKKEIKYYKKNYNILIIIIIIKFSK